MTLKEYAKWTINEERVRLSDDTFEEVFWSHIRSVAGFVIASAGAVAFPVTNLLALPFILAALWWLPPTAGAYYHWRESSQEAGEA